jgi:predicted enzyme related to lactoylglutathione lyase
VGHWHVDDLAAAIARCAAAGGRLQQSLRDVGGREKIALVQDADGNVIGLPQPASA